MPLFYDQCGIKVEVEEIFSPLPLITGWYFMLSLSCPTVHLERPQVNRKGFIIMPVEMFQSSFSLQEIRSFRQYPSARFQEKVTLNAPIVSLLF